MFWVLFYLYIRYRRKFFKLLKYYIASCNCIKTLKSEIHAHSLSTASLTCPGVHPGASRQFVDGGPGANRDEPKGIRMRLYIPSSATDLTRFWAKCDHGLSQLCYG